MLNFLVFIIGFYCVLESISAAAEMDKGDKFCRMTKFLLAAVSGAFAIYVSITGAVSIWLLVLITSIALGIWPRMVYRIFGGQREADRMKRGAR